MELRAHFAGDNCAGICAEVWRALELASRGHVPSYGEDDWTARATQLVQELFDTPCEVHFVFSGTAANALALASLGRAYHGVICHQAAHIATAECGAPEFFSSGMKLLPIPGALGKISATDIAQAVERNADFRCPRAGVVSVTEPTEFGTLYSPPELRSIGEAARRYGLRYHMDGARLANAAASLRARPAELTSEAGVDVLSFGNTKNGGLASEAIVFFDHDLAQEFASRQKQAGQLCAKMRFLAATWVGLLQDGTWLRHASHANAMARELHDRLAVLPETSVLFPVETNAVFVHLPYKVVTGMRERGWLLPCLGLDSQTDVRLMCAWDTREEHVARFVTDLQESAAT